MTAADTVAIDLEAEYLKLPFGPDHTARQHFAATIRHDGARLWALFSITGLHGPTAGLLWSMSWQLPA